MCNKGQQGGDTVLTLEQVRLFKQLGLAEQRRYGGTIRFHHPENRLECARGRRKCVLRMMKMIGRQQYYSVDSRSGGTPKATRHKICCQQVMRDRYAGKRSLRFLFWPLLLDRFEKNISVFKHRGIGIGRSS